MPDRLLPLLSQTPQSGSALSALLGVGRVTVHTLAHQLLQSGVPLLISRRGYALAEGTPTPAALQGAGWSGPYHYCAQVGSTQDEVRRWADDPHAPAPHGAALLAESQRSGRGRRGRRWQAASAAGSALTFSVLLRPAAISALPLLPLAAGVALARAAQVTLGAAAAVGLKWPNDLLTADGRKLAGILLEADVRGEEVRRAVLGIGLNVFSAPPQAACLQELLAPNAPALSRAEVLAEVLRQLEVWLGAADAEVLAAWTSHSFTLGRAVQVQTPTGTISGVAQGLNAQGELLLLTPAGKLHAVSAGDVQLVGTLAAPHLLPHSPEDST